MNRQALVFAAPRRIDVVDEPLPAPGPGALQVRTLVSAISAGTELLAYRGQIPAQVAVDDTLAALGGSFAFPFRFGYASVGEVIAVGAGVDPSWRGRTVFAFHPHASAFVVPVGDAIAVPAEIAPERAALLALMETAVNLVLDGRPLLGERVALVGQGMVGLLVTALLARFPLESLRAIERVPLRAQAARALGAEIVAETRDADLVYELTGDPAALDVALAAVGAEGRVIVGSWYGSKRAPIDLGGDFHRGRVSIASSQVSRIAPALSGRWDRARRFATAWRALATLDLAPLITHRFALPEAGAAYELLDRSPERALQVLLLSGE